MFSCDEFLRVDDGLGRLSRPSREGEGLCLVGLKDLETPQFLVDEVEGLEFFRLEDLLVEPRLDLVLFGLGEFLVDVVDVAVELEERDLGRGGKQLLVPSVS